MKLGLHPNTRSTLGETQPPGQRHPGTGSSFGAAGSTDDRLRGRTAVIGDVKANDRQRGQPPSAGRPCSDQH